MEIEMMKHSGENDRSSTSITMCYLPIEMITEILARLPVKPTLRFRSVCKAWQITIDNPEFSRMHSLMMMRRRSSSSRSFILYNIYVQNFTIFEEEGGILKCSNVKYDIDKQMSHFVGSCNGLLCTYLKFPPLKSMFIWNPVTKDYLELPQIPPFNQEWVKVRYGFGVDPITDKLKVVLISQLSGSLSRDVQVYTLGSQTWEAKSITIPRDIRFTCNAGIFLNGSLLWNGTDYDCLDIVSFDLGSEQFSLVPSPNIPMDRLSLDDIQFGVLGDCLCLSYCFDECYDIWVMKEYKVKESWIKQFVIRKSIIGELGIFKLFPVLIRMTGELILLCNQTFLISYDLDSEKPTQFVGWKYDTFLPHGYSFVVTPGFHSVHYIRSLISQKIELQ